MKITIDMNSEPVKKRKPVKIGEIPVHNITLPPQPAFRMSAYSEDELAKGKIIDIRV